MFEIIAATVPIRSIVAPKETEMKALVKSRAARGLWLQDVPEPEPGINDVKIRVLCTGICGTDLHIYDWNDWARSTIHVPLVIGHEFSGEVVGVGSNVADLCPGDLVSGEGHVVCGRCRNCLAGRRHLCAHTQGVGVNRPGAFAEYVVLPMMNVWKHTHPIPPEVAAIFDPFGNAVHTALSFPVLGEDVLVTGAGPIGIMAAVVARFAGARHVVITDVNPHRLELARKAGNLGGGGYASYAAQGRTEAIEYARRFRRGSGNVRVARGVSRDAGKYVPWRQDRHTGNSAGGDGD